MNCNRSIHANLNEAQHKAVHLKEGNYVIAATAGAGKTTVVTLRIEQLLTDGADPTRIGAFTFTRDAAQEMRARGNLLGFPKELRISTLHSLAYEILREDGQFWGGKFKVDDQRQIFYEMKNILSREYRDRGMDPKVGMSLIGLAKANCLSLHPELTGECEEKVLKLFNNHSEKRWLAPHYKDLYKKLEVVRVQRGLIDYDDMLILGWLTLATDLEVADRWSSKFDYVMVDEAQDSASVQNAIATILAKNSDNFTQVGDVQQSIYKWRGAKPEEFVDFATKFKVVQLPINYRSTKQICKHATLLTKDCKWNVTGATVAHDGAVDDMQSVLAVEFHTPEDEAASIARDIKDYLEEGAEPKDFAIIYRVVALLSTMEDALIKANIPYVVKSGATFYDRKEVKDVLAYLRVAALRDPTEQQVKRAIHAPFRYLGKAYVQAVEDVQQANKVSFLDALKQYKAPRENQTTTALKFYELLYGLNSMYVQGSKPLAIMNTMLERTRYLQSLKQEEGEDGPDPDSGKAAHVHQLLRIAESFKTTNQFLDYVEEMERVLAESRRNKDINAVTLSTIHSVKGLEWDYVYGIGWNSGILPHAKNPDKDEELRLAFVALTRARKRFQCSWSKTALTPGGLTESGASSFILKGQFPVRRLAPELVLNK